MNPILLSSDIPFSEFNSENLSKNKKTYLIPHHNYTDNKRLKYNLEMRCHIQSSYEFYFYKSFDNENDYGTKAYPY